MEREQKLTQDLSQFCKDYLDTWIKAMNDDSSKLLSSWHGSQLSDWTKAHMYSVLYVLAEKYGYKNGDGNDDGYATSYQKEYYRVDFSMYTHFDKACYWTLDYAVEHENDEFELDSNEQIKHKGWFDEFAKLLPLKCAKARVIIGYDKFTAFDRKLKHCCELLECADIQPSLADSPILLIIFPRTKYINRVCKSTENSVDILRIVYFHKDKSVDKWIMNDRFEKEVLDEKTAREILDVYAMIDKT